MQIIEIKALENGSHRNQTASELTQIPEGWAVIPDNMETPNFPFGDIEAKDEDIVKIEEIEGEKVEKVIGTRKVVTKWTPGIVPEPDPLPEPEETITLQLTKEQYDKLMSLLS